MPVAISLDLTVPAFAAQSGPRITPKGGVSFYANGYKRSVHTLIRHGPALGIAGLLGSDWLNRASRLTRMAGVSRAWAAAVRPSS